MRIKTVILLVLLPLILWPQKIDQTVSFRSIGSDSYFRFHYDNDYFAATDENYTQGYNFEFVSPSLEKNPVNTLFLQPKNMVTKYGLSIEHIGFTPNNYELEEIQFGDRPFAAAIMLKSFAIAFNKEKQTRLSQSLSLGIIGPGAFGKEMQVGIHEATGNKTPIGWDNQIKNDVVLNYRIAFEKQLYQYNNLIAINANSALQLGTLFTNASIGSNITIGKLNTAFITSKSERKFQVYAYGQPQINIIGYDASLQGGLFNKESPYTISSDSLERFTAQFNYGLIIKTKTLYFEYTRSDITREFKTGSSAKWGGIRIGFTF
ncbi:lipid A deacylase LpxR family protein [Winogradskyella sp. PE311]|uniref:lipid A deacylase LpxR family protein n=1 Tax=Winogradskyella sp. PE311 TaxID=3366943 RepID=UPI00397FD3F3